MIVSAERTYTPDDLLLTSDGPRHDLIDGQLVERHMGSEAGLVNLALTLLLGSFVRDRGLGIVLPSEAGYQIFGPQGNNVRFPDASFVARGRLPNERVPRGHMRIVPDLVLEVVSPRDEAEEAEQKIENYLEVGVRLIWVVFPSTRRIMVYRINGTVARLRSTDELNGEEVVPGFACPVAAVFAGV